MDTRRILNVVPDGPDARDIQVKFEKPSLLAKMINGNPLPSSVDLRSRTPVVYDQLSIGSCVSNAICAAHEYLQSKQGVTSVIRPSRLYLYYYTRKAAGQTKVDSGSSIRDGIKCMGGRGACSEKLYAYDVLLWATEPPPECTAEAYKNRCKIYARVPKTQYNMESCLSAGIPIVFGMHLYESFNYEGGVNKTGIMVAPDKKKEKRLGGHALLIIGFNRYNRQFLVRNSWGPNWGMRGHLQIPYDVMLSDLTFDHWSLSLVATPPTGASLKGVSP